MMYTDVGGITTRDIFFYVRRAVDLLKTPKVNTYIIINRLSLTIKAATLIFISGRGSAISSAKQGNSGSIYNLVKN